MMWYAGIIAKVTAFFVTLYTLCLIIERFTHL